MPLKCSTARKEQSTTSPGKLWVPHHYQKQAVNFLLERPQSGLFLDPGMGKTSTVLDVLTDVKGPTLIIAPLRPCHMVWPAEIGKWSQFARLSYTVLHGKDKDERASEKHDIYIINPDGLEWLTTQHAGLVERCKNLVVDESSQFKYTNTKRFKLLKPFLQGFKRRHILTGTPAPNGIGDLFGQMYLLDSGASLGRYVTHFRNKYFYQAGYGGYDWTPFDWAPEAIYDAIAPFVLRLSAEDHLDLPELVTNTITVRLPFKAQRVYSEVERSLFAILEEGLSVEAVNKAVAWGKCRQIANGGVYATEADGRVAGNLHYEKADAVKDLANELQGEQLLVLYEFEHDKERLLEVLGKDTPVLGGSSIKKDKALEVAWNERRVGGPVLAHPKSIGHGLNMQAGGHHVVWHSIPVDFELYDQTIKRLHRQGQKAGRVFVHHIVAEGTLDETVVETLAGKERTQDALFNALKLKAKGAHNYES